jgi:hypothetical protein
LEAAAIVEEAAATVEEAAATLEGGCSKRVSIAKPKR